MLFGGIEDTEDTAQRLCYSGDGNMEMIPIYKTPQKLTFGVLFCRDGEFYYAGILLLSSYEGEALEIYFLLFAALVGDA